MSSTIDCVSARGQSLRPLIIFKEQSLQVQWFPTDDVPDWQYTYPTNGWTSNQHGVHWLKRIFIPETALKSTAEARMLICDGHGSHAITMYMWAALCANVHLVFLPPHCSHVLQPLPLDVNFFGILKGSYRKQIQDLS